MTMKLKIIHLGPEPYQASIQRGAEPAFSIGVNETAELHVWQGDGALTILEEAAVPDGGKPENIIRFVLRDGEEVLCCSPDGFYVRGVLVPQDEGEAKFVYDAFMAFVRSTEPPEMAKLRSRVAELEFWQGYRGSDEWEEA